MLCRFHNATVMAADPAYHDNGVYPFTFQASLSESSKKRALVLIDALSQLGSPEITTVLAQHILRSPQRDGDLVLRTLLHLATALQHSNKGQVIYFFRWKF